MKQSLVWIGWIVGLAAPALGRDGPSWYQVELEGGNQLTVRLVGEEKDFYFLNYQGSVLKVAKSGIRKFEKLSETGSPPAGKAAPGDEEEPEGAGGGSGKKPSPAGGKKPEVLSRREEIVRTAVESLAAQDDSHVAKASQTIAADFDLARPILHQALRHPSSRVRLRVVKILGEKGNVKDDLAAVSDRLNDEKGTVRLAASMAVRNFGNAGFHALKEYLEKETVPNNRKVVIRTFHLWKEPRAVAPLVDRLGREPDPSVREFIARALEFITGQKLGSEPGRWIAYLAEEERRRDSERLLRN